MQFHFLIFGGFFLFFLNFNARWRVELVCIFFPQLYFSMIIFQLPFHIFSFPSSHHHQNKASYCFLYRHGRYLHQSVCNVQKVKNNFVNKAEKKIVRRSNGNIQHSKQWFRKWHYCWQVDRHSRRLDQELSKFKMELEADNAGITEMLEKRNCILCFH